MVYRWLKVQHLSKLETVNVGVLNDLVKIFGIVACIILTPAHAFLTDSQYHVATEPEHLLLDSYTHWDSEADSDFFTYQRPIEWDGLWYRGTRVFDLSVGSISSKQFLYYQRLKLHHGLSESVEFRLHWLQERDFEEDRIAMPLELRFRLSERWFLSVLGQPSLYKSEDDVGFAVAFRPSDEREIQITGIWGDFQRNIRNLDTDEWGQAPQAWTLTSTDLSSEAGPSDFRRFEYHIEPKSIRTQNGVPVTSLSYQSLYLSGFKTRKNGHTLGYRIFADRAFHDDHVNTLVRLRHRSILQAEYGSRIGPHMFRPGFTFTYRENRINQHQEIHRAVLPYFWFEFPTRSKNFGISTWSVGYDATVFDRDSTLKSDDRALEHRLNLKSSLKFSKAGELAFLFTFDLDRFGSGETWEGGAGQFRLDF